jgi:hypothetical protein
MRRERFGLYAAGPLATIAGPANGMATPDGEGSHHRPDEGSVADKARINVDYLKNTLKVGTF